MPTFLSSYHLINPSSINQWVTVDLSSVLPEEAIGIICHIDNIGYGAGIGFYADSCTWTDSSAISYYSGYTHNWIYSSVGNDRKIKYYSESYQINFYVTGYFTSEEAVFFSTPVTKTLSSAGNTLDFTSNIGTDSIQGIFYIVRATNTIQFYIRKYGSGDAYTQGSYSQSMHHGVIGVDSSNRAFLSTNNYSNTKFYLTGYIKSGFTFLTDAVDAASSTPNSTWNEIDFTSGNCVAYLIHDTGISYAPSYEYGFRKSGDSSTDISQRGRIRGIALIEASEDGKIESYTSSSFIQFLRIASTPKILPQTLASPFISIEGNFDYSPLCTNLSQALLTPQGSLTATINIPSGYGTYSIDLGDEGLTLYGSIDRPPEHNYFLLDGILDAKYSLDLEGLLNSKIYCVIDGILEGNIEKSFYLSVPGVVRGIDVSTGELDGITSGTTVISLSGILKGRPYFTLNGVAGGSVLNEFYKRNRIFLSDELRLRQSTVYPHAVEIEPLKWVYGDLSNSRIKTTSVDGVWFHVADHPMMSIGTVYIDGTPVSSGYKTYTSYSDVTGNSVSCIVMDSEITSQVSCSGKGRMNSQGFLIENPSEIVKDILLELQKYDSSVIDKTEFGKFYTGSIKREVKLAFVLSSGTLRDIFDKIAYNIGARWLFSDGRSVMRYRWEL